MQKSFKRESERERERRTERERDRETLQKNKKIGFAEREKERMCVSV